MTTPTPAADSPQARHLARRRVIQQALESCTRQGPTRVMVGPEDYAVTSDEASARGVKPVVVFVREDGWTLGAPADLVRRARALWADQWVAEAKWEPCSAYSHDLMDCCLTCHGRGGSWEMYSVRDVEGV